MTAHRHYPSVVMRAVCFVALLAAVCSSSAEECVKEAPQTIHGLTAEFESCTAVVDEVITANSEGYRFIAYATKWRGQRVIVSDFSAESDLAPGDHIFFTVMKAPPLNKTGTARKHIQFIFISGYSASSQRK